ncbi:MAG: hypothetical protein ABI193_07395 [Minicystis sp.]
MSEGEAPPPPKQDVIFVHSPTESGDGLRILRKRDDSIELGELRPVQEGKAIHGEVVKLSPRNDHDRLFDVEVLVPRTEAQATAARGHAGPARVANEAYRENWEAIFGTREEPGLPN